MIEAVVVGPITVKLDVEKKSEALKRTEADKQYELVNSGRQENAGRRFWRLFYRLLQR